MTIKVYKDNGDIDYIIYKVIEMLYDETEKRLYLIRVEDHLITQIFQNVKKLKTEM